MSILVVTDSTALMPPEFITGHGVVVVPLTITWNGEQYRDGVDMTYAQFAARARNGSTPKTSAPSPGEYASAYGRALRDAEELFVLTPPAELSATYSNAILGAQAVAPDRISVFDARSAAAGQGLVTMEAARTAAREETMDVVRARASLAAGRVRLVATLERLDYLRRSGRVPAVAAFATDALNIHPVFRFVNGTPSIAAAARGARRAADRLFSEWTSSREPRAGPHVIVMHSSRDQEAGELRDRVGAGAPDADVSVVEATAAMAAHLGPGLLGLAWWWEPATA